MPDFILLTTRNDIFQIEIKALIAEGDKELHENLMRSYMHFIPQYSIGIRDLKFKYYKFEKLKMFDLYALLIT